MANANLLTNAYVSVEHLYPDSNPNTEGYQVDLSLTAVPCNIQPTSAEVTMLYGGAFGKAYTLYTTQSGILETDKLTVSGSLTKYIVKGKQYFGYGLAQHGEYYIEEIL